MRHVCYAYFSKSNEERNQTMIEHIERGLEFLEDVYLKRGFSNYIATLGRCLGLEIPFRECVNALYASYMFHDLGKLSMNYQSEKSGFSGHEIISSGWIVRHGSLLGLNEMMVPVALSILLHHHDIRRTTTIRLRNVYLCDECLKEVLRIYKLKTNIDLLIYEIEFKEVSSTGLLEILARTPEKDKILKFFRLSYPLLQAVHSADNYAAIGRQGKRTVLSDEILTVLKAFQTLRENFGRTTNLTKGT